MAVYSMTGYASVTRRGQSATLDAAEGPGSRGGAVTVELRSVNSRFLDLTLRLGDEHRGLEPALRDLVSAALKRGKVELRLSVESAVGADTKPPAAEQLMTLARLEGAVQSWLPKAAPMTVAEVLAWCRASAPRSLDEEMALAAAREAVSELARARAREGERLVAVLRERVERLRALAAQAQPLVPQVVARQQQRFVERWQAALEAAGAQSAQAAVSLEQARERALNEAAAYALRIDVAEELARLQAHLDEVARLLGAGGEVGKRLDFLIQELHREANTLGSKSAALELTQISVEMKVAIEQMREQVQNIE